MLLIIPKLLSLSGFPLTPEPSGVHLLAKNIRAQSFGYYKILITIKMCESSSSMFSIYHMFYCIIMLILGLNRCTLRTIKCIIIIRIVNLFIRIYMPFGYSQFAINCLSLMHVDQRLGHCVLSGQIKVAGSDTGLGQFTSLHHYTCTVVSQ